MWSTSNTVLGVPDVLGLPERGPADLAQRVAYVLLAGLFFIGTELLLSMRTPKKFLRQQLRPADTYEQSKDADTLIPLALYVMSSPEMRRDRLYSTTTWSSLMAPISAGYFLYDLYVCIFRYEGVAYLIHGAVCCTLYSHVALSGFLHFYGAMFLLWELSSPCVYCRWFMANSGLATSKAYIVNGLAMLATFFLCRNLGGSYMAINFWRVTGRELSAPRQNGISPIVLWTYRCCLVTMTLLNAQWFYRMLRGALRVLSGPRPKAA